MKVIITITIIFFLTCASVFAQEEKAHVQDNGGGTITGGGYSNLASIGQAVICMSSGGSFNNYAGFIGALMGSSMAIEEKPPEDQKLPDKLEIGSAYPNPFNAVTRFEISVPEQGLLLARFYDVNGRLVYGENKEVNRGTYNLDFDAGELPSGTYLYNISMGNQKFSGKVILLK